VTIELDNVEQPLRKLRKFLAEFPANPRPEEVHALRTQSRRLEAIISAMLLDLSDEPRRLLKAIAPLRKSAGQVRDMDVLIGKLLTLPDVDSADARLRLVEHLSELRQKSTKKLHRVVADRRKEACKHLRRSSKLVKDRLKEDKPRELNGATAPEILVTELSHWPKLDSGNLHEFRIRIKELRYMLQLSCGADETRMDILGEVKDTIGEWHDWMELLKIANKVLDPEADVQVLKQIETIGNSKLHLALDAANLMRRRYLPSRFNEVTAKGRKLLARR
jgi:CHAD domain-containing protein